MWRPKDGFERRFEIQRKEDYEREEREKENEREREGENYQGMFKTQQAGMLACKEKSDRFCAGPQLCAGVGAGCHQGAGQRTVNAVTVEGTRSSGGASVT